MKSFLSVRFAGVIGLWLGGLAFGAGRPAPGVTASGLRLTVPPFTCETVRFEGASIDALPARVQYLALNLGSRTLHALPRELGDGDLVLAKVTTSGTEVTAIEPTPALRLPATRIPRTLSKLQRKEPLAVKCFGSSLVANGAGKDGWQTLMFDRNHGDARFRVGGPAPGGMITNTNYGVGGTTARYSAALFGEAIQGGRRFQSSVQPMDLAIVALLPNGGDDRNAVYEGVVRRLRARKVEVLLLTDNSVALKGNASGLWGDGAFVRALADRYGCAIADTAAYMWEAELRGEKVYGDSIHQNAAGHAKWAEAACGALALTGGSRTPAPPAPATGATIEPAFKIPGVVEVVFDPKNIGGARVANGSGNSLAKVYGVPEGGRLELVAGNHVLVEHARMAAADFVCDASSGFTAEVRERGKEPVVKTVAYKAPEKIGSRPQTITVFAAGELKGAAARSYDVTITSGALWLYAVAYHSP